MSIYLNGEELISLSELFKRITDGSSAKQAQNHYDFNSLQNGVVITSGGSYENYPSDANPYSITFGLDSDGYNRHQIMFSADNKMFIRTRSGVFKRPKNDNWSDWKEIGGVIKSLYNSILSRFSIRKAVA